jgi:hypothetical protein
MAAPASAAVAVAGSKPATPGVRIGCFWDRSHSLHFMLLRAVTMLRTQQYGSGAMMVMKRNDISAMQSLRSSRMFRENQQWYFRTREGQSIGPFADELEASTQLEVYIRLVEVGLLPAANT